jgi:hypothetical protein
MALGNTAPVPPRVMQNVDYHVDRLLQAERDQFVKFIVQGLSWKLLRFSVGHEIPRFYVNQKQFCGI